MPAVVAFDSDAKLSALALAGIVLACGLLYWRLKWLEVRRARRRERGFEPLLKTAAPVVVVAGRVPQG